MTVHALPYTNLVRCLFTPLESIGRASIGRGLSVNISETAERVWQVEIQTIPLWPQLEPRANWRAWRAKLRGGINLFSTWDVSKPTPLAYPTAAASTDISGAWDGTATVTALGASGALGLSGLPASYVLSAGDYIGLEEGGRYDLYEVATSVTANGSGAVTVSVIPHLRTTVFTTAAVARLWRPVATFIIDPGSWSEGNEVGPSPIFFSGIQRI